MPTTTVLPLGTYPAGQQQFVLAAPAPAVTIAVHVPVQAGNSSVATALLEDGPTNAGPWRWRAAAGASARGADSTYRVEGLQPWLRMTTSLTGSMQLAVTETH